jgi:hypothetical protein
MVCHKIVSRMQGIAMTQELKNGNNRSGAMRIIPDSSCRREGMDARTSRSSVEAKREATRRKRSPFSEDNGGNNLGGGGAACNTVRNSSSKNRALIAADFLFWMMLVSSGIVWGFVLGA